jgi:sodium-independent sulfate anion transporter 11
MRNAVVILLLSVTAWLYCRRRKDSNGDFPITVLGNVPPGLTNMGVPRVESALVSVLAPQIPVTAIIAFLEHMAVVKSM